MELATLAIVGAVVSVITQGLKKWGGVSGIKTLGSVIVLSLIAAVAYNYLQATGVWEQAVKVLASASLIYNFIIQHFE